MEPITTNSICSGLLWFALGLCAVICAAFWIVEVDKKNKKDIKQKFIVDNENLEMFEVFCELHPHEAFDLNKEKFCDFMRKQINSQMDNEEIESLINETR
jgi:hypothetical protein